MSIMSGLIETGAERPIEPQQSLLGEWMACHAWSVILTFCIAFWGVVAGLLLWG